MSSDTQQCGRRRRIWRPHHCSRRRRSGRRRARRCRLRRRRGRHRRRQRQCLRLHGLVHELHLDTIDVAVAESGAPERDRHRRKLAKRRPAQNRGRRKTKVLGREHESVPSISCRHFRGQELHWRQLNRPRHVAEPDAYLVDVAAAASLAKRIHADVDARHHSALCDAGYVGPILPLGRQQKARLLCHVAPADSRIVVVLERKVAHRPLNIANVPRRNVGCAVLSEERRLHRRRQQQAAFGHIGDGTALGLQAAALQIAQVGRAIKDV
jgi:hypothetical protein